MGMDSQTNEQPSEEALLELGFGPDPPAAVVAPTEELSEPLPADQANSAASEEDQLEADLEMIRRSFPPAPRRSW